MPSLNICHLMGNITRTPELKYTPKGTAVCSFGIAINRVWKNEAGEKMEETTFVDVECWGAKAEALGKYFDKGDPIYIQGRLKLDQWDDAQSGQKRSKLKVVLEEFQFLKSKGGADDQGGRVAPRERRSEGRETEGGAVGRQEQPRPAARPVTAPPRPPADPDLDPDEDTLPF